MMRIATLTTLIFFGIVSMSLAVDARVIIPVEQYQFAACEDNEVVFVISDSVCPIDISRLYFSIINRSSGETLHVSSPSPEIDIVWAQDSIIASVTIPESVRGESGDTIGVVLDSAFAIRGNCNIYVSDWSTDRIVGFDDMTGSGWAAYGSSGSGVGEFNEPWEIAVGPDGRIYVADSRNHRIIRINNLCGEGWVSYGTAGFGVGEFAHPVGIAVGPDSRIYIVDSWNQRIVRIDDMTGAGWISFGTGGTGEGEFGLPTYIAVGPDGKIHVTEPFRSYLVRIDNMTGAGWITYGSEGSGVGQFGAGAPDGIAIGPDGRIYVVDERNCRIVRIDDMTGAGWTTFGHYGCWSYGIGDFCGPITIDLDSYGRIYVADYGNSCIVRINDMTGAGWTTYGSWGTGIGQFDLPFGIAVAP